MQDHVPYFAYGANMARRVLARRGIEPLARHPARLRDFRLAFELAGVPPFDPAFATIVPTPGDEVHGVLVRLHERDWRKLVVFEFSYGVRTVPVEVDGEVVDAQTFVAKRRVEGRKPSPRYVSVLLEGAREAGLPQPWIERLERQPTAREVPFSAAIVHAVETFVRIFRAS